MTCRSCEVLLEKSIKSVNGVRAVNVHHRRGEAVIFSDGPLDQTALAAAVERAGAYRVGIVGGAAPWFSKDVRVYVSMMMGLLVLGTLVIVWIISGAHVPTAVRDGAVSPTFALLIGLTAGFSTCMALIGGIVLATSARFAQDHATLSRWQKFQPHIAFNTGRIIGFTLLGGALGFFGSALRLSDSVIGLLTVAVGVVMILLGMKITGISPRIAQFSPTLPRFLQWRPTGPERGPLIGAASSGALSFFLPCGFTLAMQLAAISSGNFVAGALLMGAFALGTTPGLLGLGGLTAAARGAFATVFFSTAGIAVLALGAYNMQAGWTVLSFGEPPAGRVVTDTVGTVETIRMEENDYGYNPTQFSVRQGSTVRWVIDAKNPYSCASFIRAPRLGIAQALKQGENTITFVADTVGEIAFSCSMGMYRGTITVLPATS